MFYNTCPGSGDLYAIIGQWKYILTHLEMFYRNRVKMLQDFLSNIQM
jgi:hypothetical protein